MLPFQPRYIKRIKFTGGCQVFFDAFSRQTHEQFSFLKISRKAKIFPKVPYSKTLKRRGKSDFSVFNTKLHISIPASIVYFDKFLMKTEPF